MAENSFGINFQSIKNRIALSFGAIILAFTILAGITAWQEAEILHSKDRLNQNLRVIQIKVGELQNAVQQTNLALQNYLLNRNLENDVQRNRLWQTQITPLIDSLEFYKKIWTSEDVKVRFATLLMNLKKLRSLQDEVAKLILQGAGSQAISNEDKQFAQAINPKTVFEEKILELIDIINNQFTTFQNLQKKSWQDQMTLSQKRYNFYWWIEVTLTAILFFGIIILAYLLRGLIFRRMRKIQEYILAFNRGEVPKSVQKNNDEVDVIINELENLGTNLLKIKDFANTVGKGEFDKDIEIFNRQGELGQAIAEMHDGLINIAVRDRQRNWTNEGIALFGELLREYNDIQALYDELIANLVKYIMANQGGVFILEDLDPKNPVLELKSVYAYDRKRFVERTIRPGQGLIGQAWLEKDVIYLENASEAYVQISSGLGKANPRSLLIVPMISSDSIVLGALELASFKVFETHEIDFVKRVGEMIVSAISSIKNNQKNRILLEEAQKATEQLRFQEQEMRQNLEQLMQAQADMTQNQAELIGQTQAIKTTLATVEFDVNDMILNANDIFLDAIRYGLGEVVGQPYRMFVDEEDFGLFDYQKFWQTLREGTPQQREIKVLTKDKSEVWYNATFTPIKDNNDRVYKIIKLGIETTEQKQLSATYQKQFEAINKSNAIIEFTLQGNVLDANDLYLRKMAYKLEEIKGKNHHIFVAEAERNSPDYLNFWSRLLQEGYISGTFLRMGNQRQEVWWQGTYNVVSDMEGKPYKIIKIAQEITQEKELTRLATEAYTALEAQKTQLESQKNILENQNTQLLLKEQEWQEMLEKAEKNHVQSDKNQSNVLDQYKAINTAMAVVEYTMNGTILSANDNFLQIFKYQLNELIGLHHDVLTETHETLSPEYHRFWAELNQGISQVKNVKRITKDGQEVWLHCAYTPVQDETGKFHKIVQISLPPQIQIFPLSNKRVKTKLDEVSE
jgi:PAS domain S-box-containing protein